MARKTKQELSYDEIRKELAEIKDMLARREHIDDDFKVLKHEFEGNGKLGFRAVRDQVTEWIGDRKNFTRTMISIVVTNLVVSLLSAIIR